MYKAKKIILSTIFNLAILISIGCQKNYYNDMIEWTSKIEIGTSIKTVKNQQPDFIKIDWNNPDTFDSEIRYEIIEIEGNNDMLKMQNFVVFKDEKYVRRDYHK